MANAMVLALIVGPGASNLSNWTPGIFVEGNNAVFSVEDNKTEHKVCVVSANARGQGKWYVFGNDYAATAATSPVAPLNVTVRGSNQSLDFEFDAVLTGPASVAKYEYSYDNGTTWTPIEILDLGNMTVNDGVITGKAKFSIYGLENDKEYSVKIRAINTISTTGVESDVVKGTPKYIKVNYDDPNTVLAKATAEFIYAEDVPHSDFWRMDTVNKRWSNPQGGRKGSDRLVRGKETALGNLFADALQWYAKKENYEPDFSWLIGDMISTGITNGTFITPRFLAGIITSDYQDDTVVIVKVPGSALIGDLDYDLDLNNYPAVGTDNGYATTLFGQAASVYRNGHYGGSGGTTYNGVWWGIPSKEARYTIEYLPYSLDAFNTHFNSKPECVAIRDAKGMYGDKAYDVKADDKKCYLLTYAEANPVSGDPTEISVMGYKRGKIKKDTLFINREPVDPEKTYTIATTRKIAGEMYLAFFKVSDYKDTGVTLKRAVSEYLYEQKFASGATPKLDGRVVLEGGVPGDSNNDYKSESK